MSHLEEQEIIKIVDLHTLEIRKYSNSMKHMSDIDILKRTLPMIVAIFKTNFERIFKIRFKDVGDAT